MHLHPCVCLSFFISEFIARFLTCVYIIFAGQTPAQSGEAFKRFIKAFILNRSCPGVRVVSISGNPLVGLYHHLTRTQASQILLDLSSMTAWNTGAVGANVSAGTLIIVEKGGRSMINMIQLNVGIFHGKFYVLRATLTYMFIR